MLKKMNQKDLGLSCCFTTVKKGIYLEHSAKI
jgi:hypothetical protein